MSTDRLQIIYEKLQRKGHVWYSIIKAIESATPKLRKKVKTSYDRLALSSISTQITKARREHSIFQTRLKEIKNQMQFKTLSYYDIKNDLNELNNEAQAAIEKLRDIAKDIVDIRDINSTSASTKTTQDRHIGSKPPTPPSQSISDSSSPASTMLRQRTEISDLKDRIKTLRDSFSREQDNKDNIQEIVPSETTNKSTKQIITKKVIVREYAQKSPIKNVSTKDKHSRKVFDFQQKEYLKKFDKADDIQSDLKKTWMKLDRALNQNATSNKLIANEIEYLRKKVSEYQEIVQSAAELCQNSVMLINDKNQDLNAIISEKQTISKEWTSTKIELEQLKKSKANIDTEYRKQCALNSKLETENETLQDNLRNMQNEFQTEIDTLKHELNAQIEYSQCHKQTKTKSYGIDKNSFDSILDALLNQLEIEDENAKYEISKIMKSYHKKRQRLFGDVKFEKC